MVMMVKNYDDCDDGIVDNGGDGDRLMVVMVVVVVVKMIAIIVQHDVSALGSRRTQGSFCLLDIMFAQYHVSSSTVYGCCLFRLSIIFALATYLTAEPSLPHPPSILLHPSIFVNLFLLWLFFHPFFSLANLNLLNVLI